MLGGGAVDPGGLSEAQRVPLHPALPSAMSLGYCGLVHIEVIMSGRRLLVSQELPKDLAERTPLGLWVVWVSCQCLGLGLVKSGHFKGSGFPTSGRTVL